MSTFKEQERTYNFSDARLLELSLEKIAFAERDATELATVGVTPAWVDDLKTQALAFGAMPSDVVELGEQEEATDEKNEDADLLRDKLKELRSAAARAYGEKHADYKQFGLIGLDDSTDAQLLKTAMVALGVAGTHAAPLATKGWEAADNTELQDLITAYVGGIQNQRLEVGSRDTATENRVVAGNDLYDLVQNELCEAGKGYWRTRSEAKYNDYLIYNNETGSSGTTIVREGNVTAPGIDTVDTFGINSTPASTVQIEVTGSGLRFYFSATPGETPGPTFWDKEPGTITMTVDDFKVLTGYAAIPGSPVLNVQNIGMTTAHYKLTFTNLEP